MSCRGCRFQPHYWGKRLQPRSFPTGGNIDSDYDEYRQHFLPHSVLLNLQLEKLALPNLSSRGPLEMQKGQCQSYRMNAEVTQAHEGEHAKFSTRDGRNSTLADPQFNTTAGRSQRSGETAQ